MPILDPTSEKILAYYVGHGSKDQSAAWLHGHPDSKAKPATVHAQASKFFAQHKVSIRLTELHAEIVKATAETTQFTFQNHNAKLVELRDLAVLQGKIQAAIAAEVKRGELHGVYIRRTETGDAGDFERMSVDELKAFVMEGLDSGKKPAGKRATKH